MAMVAQSIHFLKITELYTYNGLILWGISYISRRVLKMNVCSAIAGCNLWLSIASNWLTVLFWQLSYKYLNRVLLKFSNYYSWFFHFPFLMPVSALRLLRLCFWYINTHCLFGELLISPYARSLLVSCTALSCCLLCLTVTYTYSPS